MRTANVNDALERAALVGAGFWDRRLILVLALYSTED